MQGSYTMIRITISTECDGNILDIWPSEFVYYGRYGFHCSYGYGRRTAVDMFSGLIEKVIEYTKENYKENGYNKLVVMDNDKLECYRLGTDELVCVINIIKEESEILNLVLKNRFV